MPKVSIIVPIYNVEKYLRRCLDSLVNQTMQEIEVILVNDASPDSSDVIMKEYEREYPELIKCIFLKENVRQGGARNRGLEVAKGSYVAFVDSDDWIDLDYVERLYQKAANTGSDIIYADFMINTEEKRETRPNIFPQLCGVQDERKRKMNLLLTGTGPCACIIRKDMLLKNLLLFAEKITYEDMAVCPLYAYYADQLDYAGGTFYYYYQREDSVTHDVDAEYQKEEAMALLLLLKECDKRGVMMKYPKEVEALFTKYFYAWGMYGIYNGKFSQPPDGYMKYLAEEMHKYFPFYKDNPYFYTNIEPGLIQHMFDNDKKWLGTGMDGKEAVSYVDCYCQKQTKVKIARLFKELEGRRIVLWGAGKKGREFLQSLSRKYPVEAVIDKNERIAGQVLETGQVILQPDDGLKNAEVVLIINKNYYGEIKKIVKEKDSRIKIINMDIYLLSEFSLEECLE
ncbi:MAG TPA: hypothetical protein DDY31_03100 [Lachnospiraceae bacterium]|nr:hypothetical protein [Lachnospiraceae bacterium]